MHRRRFCGSVRNSEAETERDAKMLALHRGGVSAKAIAERMGVSVVSVRLRIRRAEALNAIVRERVDPT